jgi:hypothetical protein
MKRMNIGIATVAGALALLSVAEDARAQVPPTTTNNEQSDHDKVVGHFAVGYFGITNLPIGPVPVGANFVPTPIIGARYWFMRNLGIDVGLGFSTLSGSSSATNNNVTVSADHNSQLGFALHGGVPIALAVGRHFTFELVPEANLGFTNGTIKSAMPNTPDTGTSGFLFDIGARIGGEIQFGFIGLPELALEGSVGLYLQRQSASQSVDPNSASDGSWAFGTTVGSSPWAIFTNNISALYYF